MAAPQHPNNSWTFRLVLLFVVVAMTAPAGYAYFALTDQVPVTPELFLGCNLVLFLGMLSLGIATWRERKKLSYLTIAYNLSLVLSVGWYALPQPLFTLLVVNFDTNHLRWLIFTWLWLLPAHGLITMGGYTLFVNWRLLKQADPEKRYQYTLKLPVLMTGGVTAVATVGYIIGGTLVRVLANLPWIETTKLYVLGFISSIFLAILFFFAYEAVARSFRRRLEQEENIKPVPRTRYARRLFLLTISITFSVLLLIGMVVLQSYQQITTDPAAIMMGMQRYAIASIVVLILAVIVTAYFSATLGTTLRSLATSVRRARDTVQPFTFSTYTADELEELSLAFRYYINQANELRAHLEEKVKQRTAELLKVEEEKQALELATAQQQTQFEHQRRELAEDATKKLEEKVQERTAALRDAIKHLQELDRVKSEFISLASHQLRTPLTSLRWAQHALLEGSAGKLSTDQKQIVETTLDRTLYMMSLVNELLDVTRIEDQRYDLKRTKTDMGELIKAIVNDFSDVAERKPIDLIFKGDGLPTLMVDPDKIKMAVGNVIDNAIKYTPANGSVTVTVVADATDITLTVADTGVGIPEKDMYRTFSKFFRASNAIAIHTSGSGLGLYIAKTIIEKHNGTITLESKPNEGTKVTFKIPLNQPLDEQPKPEAAAGKLGAISSLVSDSDAE